MYCSRIKKEKKKKGPKAINLLLSQSSESPLAELNQSHNGETTNNLVDDAAC